MHSHGSWLAAGVGAALLVWLTGASAQGGIYRCTQPDGRVVLSDKECERGVRRDGLSWVDVQEDQRRRDEEAKRRVEAAQRAREEAERRRLAAEEREAAAAAARAAYRPSPTAAAPDLTASEIDRLTTYATLLGRAAACNVPSAAGAQRVGQWLERRVPAHQRQQWLGVMVGGMHRAAADQQQGRSPDSCAQVRRALAGVAWP